MHYLITGHTGFKGSWLSLLLTQMGHSVSGVAHDPEPVSLFRMANVEKCLVHDVRADIRDRQTMVRALETVQPDVLVHLAAQPLVRESYRSPRHTIETNVMGTLNVLEAAGQSASLKAQLVVTTDKVYRNVNREAGYTEDEPLGGEDPYSASKAMADILTHSWATSFPGPPTAVARAGNVIGGGDYGQDRLIPDLVRSLTEGEAIRLRYPAAVRPWQHVLDCLDGYLAIVDKTLSQGGPSLNGGVWNIGPGRDSFRTVAEMSGTVAHMWGSDLPIEVAGDEPHEAGLLALDSSKATRALGWANRLDLDESVAWTVDWYKRVSSGESPLLKTQQQIRAYLDHSRGSD